MLISRPESRIRVRSTKRLNAEGIRKISEQVGSFESIQRYERQNAPRRGKRTYSTVSIIVLCIYIEISGLTYEGDISKNKLAAMGMPWEKGGYRRPSPATISDFLNHRWPEILGPAEAEYVSSILDSLPEKRFIVDSTPMEASRYSRRYSYSPHYEIRMGKCHIIMCNGYPLVRTFTDANDSDCLEQLPDGIRGVREFTSDAGYPAFYNYSLVFSKLGVVMASNLSVDSVFHEEVDLKRLKDAYASLWKESDFRPRISNGGMLRYLIGKGKEESVGVFLRNLDMRRGRRISAGYARRRHVCETVHRAMKRRMNFDVRGLRKESDEQRKSFKFFTTQILCAIFDPYYQPERFH